MTAVGDLLLVAVLLLGLALLGSSRLSTCIRLVALQGALISLLPAVLHGLSLGMHALVLVLAPLVAKGALIPWLLSRAIREAEVRREVEPFIGYTASLLLGALLTGAGFMVAARLPSLGGVSGLLPACALATVLVGGLLMVSRRKAVTQVIGYLVLENGIFLFGQSLATELPALVELGVLLDLLVGVFVMGIAIFHINREFDSIAVHELTALRD